MRSYYCLLLICTCSFAICSIAEQGALVRVQVRTIQASREVAKVQKEHVSLESEAATALDPVFADIEKKLTELPFNSFKLLAAKEQELCLKQRQRLSLPNGQSLVFRPIYMDNERVGIWIKWLDQENREILNTRVHFDPNYAVLTGTDLSPQTALILAIKAEQIQRP